MNVFKSKYGNCHLVMILAMLVCMSFTIINPSAEMVTDNKTVNTLSVTNEKMALYEDLNLDSLGLSREAFSFALAGLKNLLAEGKIQKDNLLSILDFTLPSGKKRLFVIDLVTEELVFNTYASHGKNSGQVIPTKFSNKNNSNQSSLGFYVTGDTYNGKHGESLRLLGEEKGINDKALERGIVMHSASYVDENIIASQGFIGRSLGCPALPKNVSKDIINKIKEGSCLFIYSPDKYYVSHSRMIHDNKA